MIESIDKHVFFIYNPDISKERMFGTIVRHIRRSGVKRVRTVYVEKLIFFVAAMIIALILSIIAGRKLVSAHDNRKNEPVNFTYYKSIEVQEGDTLWDIASAYADEDTSVKAYVKELKKINHLDSDSIQEGSYLTVAYTDQDFR